MPVSKRFPRTAAEVGDEVRRLDELDAAVTITHLLSMIPSIETRTRVRALVLAATLRTHANESIPRTMPQDAMCQGCGVNPADRKAESEARIVMPWLCLECLKFADH